MTNFNPEGGFKDISLWESIAEKKAGNTGAASRLITGILIGGLGVSMGAEVLGGIAAAWLVKSAWDALNKAGTRLKLVRDMGCNAFVLDEHDFRTYLQQFGDEVVYEELVHAQAQGAELSNFSANWLNTFKAKNLTPTQEVKAIDRAQVAVSAPVTADNPTKPVNSANPVKAIKDRIVNVFNPLDKAQVDIIGQMTDRVTNTLVIGIPGSGKGMLISNAIREAKRKHPELKVFVIDPKADPKEAGYFECCDVIDPYPCMDAKPSTVAVWAEEAFRKYVEFAQVNPRTLLIIDEGTMLGNKLTSAKSTLLVDKLTSYTSGGDSVGRNVWFMAQTPYVGASSLNLSVSSQMLTIVLATQENIGALSQWKSAKTIDFKSFSLDAIAELINNSGIGRAVYFGRTGQWYMMPKLTNYSGYDRDNREYLPGHEAPTTIQSLEDSFKASNNIVEEVSKQSELSVPAQKVLEWLQVNRANQWVKYKGADRDQSFINLARKHGYMSQEAIFDELITELFTIGIIELDETESAFIIS